MPRTTVDLTGQTFGDLTVIKRSERKGNDAFWDCRCLCGAVKPIRSANLRRGITKSCGCRRGGKPLDIKDQRFGRLVAKEFIYNGGRSGGWRCECDCGNEVFGLAGNLRAGKLKSCGCLQPGRCKDGAGYVKVKVPDHPFASKDRYVREHRLVVEQALGRYLLPEENVHHINGIRDDNRLENLELWSRSQPSGQRVVDKVEWAVDLLRLYAPELLSEHAISLRS